MIKVLIDSGMDQNAWLRENYDFGFLPLSIIIDGEAYLDKEEISQEELHTAMKNDIMPSTSQPSPGQVQAALEEYRKAGDQVLIITIWEKLSGTYQVVKSVVDEYKQTYPDFQVEIIDSRSASIAETLIAVQALEMIQANYSFEEVVAQAQWNAENNSIYLTVDNLEWLVKGGRLSKAAGFVGGALKVKPILTVNDEELYSAGVVRGNKRVYKKIVSKIKEDVNGFEDQVIYISHVGEEENAKRVEEIVQKEMPEAKTMIFEFGAVLAAHIGVGGVAIAALNSKPETYIIPEP
jgi:DegV family protein with EDD domain